MITDCDDDFGELEDDTPLDEFGRATNFVRGCAGTFSEKDLLYFYARYKQACDGKCNGSKPGFFEFASRKKWDAWNGLGNMAVEVAKKQYIEKLTNLKPDWNSNDAAIIKTGGGMQVKVSRMAAEPQENVAPMTACEFAKLGDAAGLQKRLAEQPSDINSTDQDEDGLTSLHWACDRGNSDIVSLLLSTAGVDVNKRDLSGQTPLHYAASCDQIKCVRLLLNFPGIDINIKDDDGFLPLDVVSSEEVKLLLSEFSSTN